MNRYICIHSHFYQPPRENPWLEEVELQESAYPYHDWNERITDECYAPNSASRILDGSSKITDIVNNYTKMSFNFGPTLLSWMHRHEPEVYKAILDSDKKSQENFSGHGSALAQVYNHMIMPLANDRDKQTQIIWGIQDFEYRFKRKPEGMWLSETAVDIKTLEVLAEHGIKFTIFAPHQAHAVRKIGEKVWQDVTGAKIDPRQSYLCQLPSGKSIALFFYDGPIAQSIAFSDLLNNGEKFAQRLNQTFPLEDDRPSLAHIATDGETYGHHHRFGDMALAYFFHFLESRNLAKITIYGEYLEKFPPTHEVSIYENTSWSCVHGIERWRSDCGCSSGMNGGWNQKWRAPLRKALDKLRDDVALIYEREMAAFVDHPWEVRNHYIEVVLDRSGSNVEKFFNQYIEKKLAKEDQVKILRLLEMQRFAMLMYTSCGWFFDDVSGIETTQIIQYATRVIQLAKEISGLDFEEKFVKDLEKVPSNHFSYGNAAVIYEKCIKPAMTDLLRVGVHYAISSLFKKYAKQADIYCYTISSLDVERKENGKQKIVTGKVSIRSDITWHEETINFAALHLGDHNISAGVSFHTDDAAFEIKRKEILDAFHRVDITKTLHLIEKHFDTGNYSLWHLFKDEQSKILYQVLDTTLEEVESSLRKINEYHSPIIQVIKQLHIPLPKVLANTVVVMMNADILQTLGQEIIDFDKLKKLSSEAKEWALEIDRTTISFIVIKKINRLMDELSSNCEWVRPLEMVESILKSLQPLDLPLDLWKAQNIFFSINQTLYKDMLIKAGTGNEKAKLWCYHFNRLGELLKVKVG